MQTGSFLLRLLTFPNYGVLPKSVLTSLETEAPAFYKWANAVIKEKSVNHIYDEEGVAEKTKERMAKMAAAAAAAAK